MQAVTLQTNKSYTIFHDVNCSSALVHVIYLIKCTFCKKQYVEKSETTFSIVLNNHRKDVKKPDAILVRRHFQEKSHVYNKHEKFIIIVKLTITTKSKDNLHQRFVERKNFGFKGWKRYTQSTQSRA